MSPCSAAGSVCSKWVGRYMWVCSLARSCGYRGPIVSRARMPVVEYDQRVERAARAAFGIGGGVAHRDQGVWSEHRVEGERLHDDLRAEERRAHPAGVDAVG